MHDRRWEILPFYYMGRKKYAGRMTMRIKSIACACLLGILRGYQALIPSLIETFFFVNGVIGETESGFLRGLAVVSV